MKHLKLVFAMILAVSLLAGCAAEILPTENTAAKYTEQERPPVSALQCTSPAALSVIHPAGGAKVIVCWTDYEAEITTIQIVDTASNTLYAETTLNGVWDCKAQTFSDGRLALCNRDALQWKFPDTSLNEIGTMTAENVDGFFSNDGSSYYYLRDHVLCRQDVAGGEVNKVTLTLDLRFLEITAFDNQTGRMVLQFYLSTYSSECGTAIADVNTGQLSMLQSERYQAVFTGDALCLLYFDPDTMGYSVSYGWDNGDFLFANASIFMDRSNELYGITGAPYLMGVATNTTLYAVGEHRVAYRLLVCRLNFADFHKLTFLGPGLKRGKYRSFFLKAHITVITAIMIPGDCFQSMIPIFRHQLAHIGCMEARCLRNLTEFHTLCSQFKCFQSCIRTFVLCLSACCLYCGHFLIAEFIVRCHYSSPRYSIAYLVSRLKCFTRF